ncbi:Ig-like domain-containing protein [Nocardioides sp. zg-1228]|uniref:Ig-like domain-containing protein n=1 Tax=Nocardioides sp. zg-1228 TaxID=2763008 RepID=UPI00164310AD|nr:Ig-like domain-containing protein [Nocardioides sp. zg-1228]MBC2933293.1 Ig-like domain repeat protein [Nocardioides sp. zg-1228]QSF56544.1 Ig-like domain repeat protein [Nocardioides sp. zg-1228]
MTPPMTPPRRPRRFRRPALAASLAALVAALLPAAAQAADDPRIGLAPGYLPWSEASSNIELLDNNPRVAPFDGAPGGSSINSDLAFTGDHAIVGNYLGFQVYDVSDPADPTLSGSFVCPGGQGDVSVFGDLLFFSVEQTSARVDCGSQGVTGSVSPERFRGVRIFDISDLAAPVQVGGVQTCRGSHTHTVVTDPDDPDNVYLYNSGTAGVRSGDELAGCESVNPNTTTGPVTTGNPAQWRIDVIKVPLAAPEDAAIVSQPRIFTDPATGAFNGLQNTLPGTPHPSGTNYSPLPNTNTCHDITAYPELGLAAGACQGNGILLDITDPVNPERIDAVSDPNFAYWHSATINNDGTKVIFTDEWGGGSGARCRESDRPEWGADAIFDIVDGKMAFRSYYKLPAPQTAQENCVAHNGSLVPVPGRDIMVQAWYQGGLSVIDFTDSANPVELAFYDRGPVNTPNPTGLNLAGYWSTYWYNGHVFGSEIGRGFDALAFTPSDLLSANEIAAAGESVVEEFNAQHQTPLRWAPSFNVAGSYLDQAARSGALAGETLTAVIESFGTARELSAQGASSAPLVRHHLDAARRLLGDNVEQVRARRAITELRDSLPCDAGCKLPTKVGAAHSPEPSSFGQASTTTVTVDRVGTEGALPTGSVVVTDKAGKQLGKATLARGTAAVGLPADLPVGTHTLTAAYAGDDTNAASSATFTATVTAATPTGKVASRTKVTVKPKKPRVKQDFSVVVTVKSRGADATGKVVVRVDGTLVKTARLSDGRVVVKVRKNLAVGAHTVSASFGGSDAVRKSRNTVRFRVVR